MLASLLKTRFLKKVKSSMTVKSEIEIHGRENNDESESFLNENYQHFSNKCLEVIRILNTGKRLTVLEAANMGISSLPRRIKDCIANGCPIKDEWVRDEKGKRLYKEYFLEITERPTKKEVINNWSEKLIQQNLF
jgi:hypothetical protein